LGLGIRLADGICSRRGRLVGGRFEEEAPMISRVAELEAM
jgi:hypothetical protein